MGAGILPGWGRVTTAGRAAQGRVTAGGGAARGGGGGGAPPGAAGGGGGGRGGGGGGAQGRVTAGREPASGEGRCSHPEAPGGVARACRARGGDPMGLPAGRNGREIGMGAAVGPAALVGLLAVGVDRPADGQGGRP